AGGVRSLGLLAANVLAVTGEVVALLLGDREFGIGPSDACFVTGLRAGLVGLVEGDLLLAPGLGHADVLRVVLHAVARGLRGLVGRLDLLLGGRVLRLRHAVGHRRGPECPGDRGREYGHCRLVHFHSLWFACLEPTAPVARRYAWRARPSVCWRTEEPLDDQPGVSAESELVGRQARAVA